MTIKDLIQKAYDLMYQSNGEGNHEELTEMVLEFAAEHDGEELVNGVWRLPSKGEYPEKSGWYWTLIYIDTDNGEWINSELDWIEEVGEWFDTIGNVVENVKAWLDTESPEELAERLGV